MRLTPNRRLARYLTERGEEEAYPFSHWIETLWEEEPAKSALLLNPAAEQILWERNLQRVRDTYPLLNIAPTVRMVMEAWALCHQWEIPLHTSDWQTEDHHLFLEWTKQFQTICQLNQWIDTPQLLSRVTLALEKGDLSLPSRIDCVGFQEWDLQQTRFLALCRRQGVKLVESSLLKQKKEVFQVAAASPEEELTVALAHIEQLLAKRPETQIGLVVPDLEQHRFEVLHYLEDRFKEDQYNVSAPLSLADYPLIDAALFGLEALEKELSFEEWSKFLRLPFLGRSFSEMAYRAQLDVLFREQPRAKAYSIEAFSFLLNSLINKLPRNTEFQLATRLAEILPLKSRIRPQRSADEWASLFTEILHRLDWPGERELNSLEYQLKNQWQEILKEYKALSSILGQHRYSEARQEVQRLCHLKKFLPQSEKAPIQVLGVLEALGLPFDHLWVMGSHRETWPKEPAPNPFIPLNLQRNLNVPRSSAKREMQVALKVLAELSRGADNVIFSYSSVVQDNKTAISPLLASLPRLSLPKAYLLSSAVKERQLALKLNDPSHFKLDFKEPAPVLQLNEKPGQGSRLFKLQSLCPFRAFAEIRLKAKPLREEQWGFSAAERGEILHQILNQFWQGLESQLDLLTLGEEGRERRLQLAVETIFKEWAEDHRHRLQPRYFALEQQRAIRLINQFIQLELRRSPFKVIAHEVEQFFILNKIPLKLRIDRIDQLETGEEILIDYKTGKISVVAWFGERLLDPQLPLYCIARNPPPQGVVFALIQNGNSKYQGLVTKQEALLGVLSAKQLARYGSAESFEQQISLWQTQLDALAQEFISGRADVAPYEGEKTCRGCHLKSLCRYTPLSNEWPIINKDLA